MAFIKILVCALVGSVAGQNFRTFANNGFSQNSLLNQNELFPEPSTTPIPILKFVDQHNTDGSYTYGFQSADGTYKLETRLKSGEVKGKYGYIDSDGNLKETSYGADTVTGFVPTVDGKVHSPPSISQPEDLEQQNLIPDFAPTPSPKIAQRPVALPKLNARPTNNNNNRASLPASRFQNFRPQATPVEQQQEDNFRVVNGRRAVLRKRVRPTSQPQEPVQAVPNRNTVNSQIIADEKESRVEALKERQRQLQILEDQRSQLVRLQQAQQGQRPLPARSETARSFSFTQQQQQFRAQPQQQELFAPLDPFVSNFNSNSGTYSIKY